MQPAYLQRAQQLIREQHKSYCFPVLRFEAPVQRALRLTPDGVAMFEAAHAETRSQDLEPAYHDAGQFYWGTAAAWLERRPLFSAAATALVIPRHHAQDIDTEEDWAFAEKLHAILNETSAQRPAST
jgi:N-acylneuraminate cytidylyltransferase